MMSTFIKIILSSPLVTKKDDADKVKEITRTVVEAYQQEENEDAPKNKDLQLSERLQKLTGQPMEACDLLVKIQKPLKTMNNWYSEYKQIKLQEHPDLELMDFIRSTVVHHYLQLQKIPTLKLIQGALQEKFDREFSVELVKQLLAINGFVWKRIYKTPKRIIAEDSNRVYERQNYLEHIKGHRKIGRHIVYINETIIKPDSDICPEVHKTCFYAAVSAYLGLIDTAIIENMANPRIEIEKFIIENVMPELPPESVIVLPIRSYHEKGMFSIPDMLSSKKDMTTWLRYHQVPHRAEMHRADLFDLIERYKFKAADDIQKFDATVTMNGYFVLRLPPQNNHLDFFFELISEMSQKIKQTNIDLEAEINKITIEDWTNTEMKLIGREKKTEAEDLKMEELVDKIDMYSRDCCVLAKDLEDCDDVDPADCLGEILFP